MAITIRKGDIERMSGEKLESLAGGKIKLEDGTITQDSKKIKKYFKGMVRTGGSSAEQLRKELKKAGFKGDKMKRREEIVKYVSEKGASGIINSGQKNTKDEAVPLSQRALDTSAEDEIIRKTKRGGMINNPSTGSKIGVKTGQTGLASVSQGGRRYALGDTSDKPSFALGDRLKGKASVRQNTPLDNKSLPPIGIGSNFRKTA